MSTILITGGAGFIGSHLANELLRHGYDIRVLDALVGQVRETQTAEDHVDDATGELVARGLAR
jgi:dTDP-L-rhamnose 4-epimerase